MKNKKNLNYWVLYSQKIFKHKKGNKKKLKIIDFWILRHDKLWRFEALVSLYSNNIVAIKYTRQ